MKTIDGYAANGCIPKCTLHGLVIYKGNDIVFGCTWEEAITLAAFILNSAALFDEPRPKAMSVEFQNARNPNA